MRKFLTMILALGLGAAHAGFGWGSEPGASSMKFLRITPTARQAGLAGAGLADPGSASEAGWNPMAGAWANSAVVHTDLVQLSDHLGARWSSLQVVQPLSKLHLLVGAGFLDVKDMQARDEDGNATGNFGAYAWTGKLGVSSDSGALTWGITGSYNHQTIAEFGAYAVLCDAVMGYRLGHNFRFAAGFFHAGYVSSFDTASEQAPMTLQAGLSWRLDFAQRNSFTAHADIRRDNDGQEVILLAGESTYAGVVSFRAGSALDAGGYTGINGGLGVDMGYVAVSYGYDADRNLKGNHHFSLDFRF